VVLNTTNKIEENMSIEKIKQFNDQRFLDDLKRVRDVVVIPSVSNVFLHICKRELKRQAETSKIHYYITENIFVVKRNVMVIV
jgi:hypothetical protein